MGLAANVVPALCRQGKIRVEIYDRNYRVVVILQGPHKGKRTLAHPHAKKPWRTIDADGQRINGERPKSARYSRAPVSLAPIKWGSQ